MQIILRKGDYVIVTSMEHNSVLRLLTYMELDGIIELTVVYADKFGYVNPEEIRNQIKSNTKLIVITHASNVIGTIVDIEKIGQIASESLTQPEIMPKLMINPVGLLLFFIAFV